MSAEDEELKSTESSGSKEGVSNEPETSEGAEHSEEQQDVSEVNDWQAEATELAEQIEAYKDQAVRAQAESQNTRRRAEQDVEKAHKFALEKFSKELLPVIDSLEKALEAEFPEDNGTTPFREGVELTLTMFLNGIRKFNLEQIDPVGHPFDPTLHEAMTMVEAPDAEPNTVVAAMQKGYTLSGRLIRPAMVVVAKGTT